MSTTPGEATADPSQLCDEARDLAERGEPDRAARLFERVLALGEVPERGQAALGLAVVLDDIGDAAGAREADWAAIATADPEYAPRAAYHLALAHERAGERAGAAEAWRIVVDFGNPAYLPPAHSALARIADEDGDHATAQDHWQQVLATGDPDHAPVAAHDLAQRLLERGEPARAQRVLAETLRTMDREREPYAYARLAVTIGMAYLDQAIGAFGAALDGADGDTEVAPLATELLARTLPLRGRGDEAWEVWERGIADPGLADQVRARLRRDFGDPAEPAGAGRPAGEADGAPAAGPAGGPGGEPDAPDARGEPWWEPYVESAARSGTVPALTGEVFGALDLMYTVVALRYAEGAGDLPDDDVEVLRQAVRVPGRYEWGAGLHESFAERLRLASGSATPVLPTGWPEI